MVDAEIDTITELSEKSGINRRTLGKVLDGTEQPSSGVMGRLIEALSIPLDKAGVIFLPQTYAISKPRAVPFYE